MRKLVLMLAVLSLAAVGIAACGGDDDDGNGNGSAATDEPAATTEEPADDATGDASAGGSEVQLSADADGALAYDQSSLEATGTMVAIAFSNPAPIVHDVRVEDASGNDLGGTEIFADATQTAVLELEPGEYTFFCSVPGHRGAGMEGTLTVE